MGNLVLQLFSVFGIELTIFPYKCQAMENMTMSVALCIFVELTHYMR